MLLLLLACPADAPLIDSSPAVEAPADPVDLGLQVSEERLTTTIAALQDLGTRHTVTPENVQARQWLTMELVDLGYEVEQDLFDANGAEAVNLVVRKPGSQRPDHVWILSAHYDSTSTQPTTDAPGADDNASGVAVVLEAARILAEVDLGDSVWFVLTGAEEQGSLGSLHMTGWLQDEGVVVEGVMAPDMIGYWPLGEGDALDILGDEDSEHLIDDMADMADRMGVAHKTWVHHGYCYGDDHTNFQEAGIPAISPMDCVEAHNLSSSGESTPHYHRSSDTLDTLHMGFTTRVGQLMVATFARWADPQ